MTSRLEYILLCANIHLFFHENFPFPYFFRFLKYSYKELLHCMQMKDKGILYQFLSLKQPCLKIFP